MRISDWSSDVCSSDLLLFLGSGDAVLQDGVEVGLDVVGVGLLVLLVGFLVVVALGLDRSDRLLFVFIFFFVGLCVVVGEVLVDEVVGVVDVFVEVEVLVDLLDVLLGLLALFVFDELVVFGHAVIAAGVGGRLGRDHRAAGRGRGNPGLPPPYGAGRVRSEEHTSEIQ